MNIDRRSFLKKSSIAITSLLLPIGSTALAAIVSDSTSPPSKVEANEINDWIWIGPDNNVTIGVSQCEVGQGIYTGIAAVIAAEMDADWEKVTVQFVTGKDAYRQIGGGVSFSQFVAASTSMTNFYERTRLAGAQARDLFTRAGALYFDIPVNRVTTENSFVINLDNQQKVAYSDLLTIASELSISSDPQLKTKSEELKNGLIGAALSRVDTPSKVNGTAIFGIDIDLPNLAIAIPWIVPSFSGEIVNIRNEAELRTLPGIIDIIQTHHWSTNNLMGHDPDISSPNTILVIAESFWQAKKALDLLDVETTSEIKNNISSETIHEDNLKLLQSNQLVTATDRGNAINMVLQNKNNDNVHEAYFKAPYIAHATMEPCNATSYYQDHKIETWGPFQGQDLVRLVLAKIHGLKPTDIIINNTYLGGSFGRKYIPDAVMHATTASKATGRPVKIIYTRETDIQNEYYRPGILGHYQAVLDSQGYPEALWVRAAGQSLFWQMKRDKMIKMGGWDETMVECVYNLSYDVPNLHVEVGHIEQPIPLSYLRGVGTTSSIFFLESFISELAAKAQIDDYEYRRQLLNNNPTALEVLDATAKAANWNLPLPENHYRGMAYNIWIGRDDAFRTYIALAIEIEVTDDTFKVTQATAAVDCGKVINPSLIKANIEGGIGFALTGALKSKLTFKDGAVQEGNFHNYPLLSLKEMPKVETVIIESDRSPQGVGEIVSGVVAPALASALLQATGNFYREMPFPNKII